MKHSLSVSAISSKTTVFHLFHHICIRRENTKLIQRIRTQRKGVREMPKKAKEKNIALRHLRAHLKLSQEKFAEQLGVSNLTYRHWESREHFTLGALQEILDAAAAHGVYLTDAEIVALSGIHKPVPHAASDVHNTANDSSGANSDPKRAELIQDGLSATNVILSTVTSDFT